MVNGAQRICTYRYIDEYTRHIWMIAASVWQYTCRCIRFGIWMERAGCVYGCYYCCCCCLFSLLSLLFTLSVASSSSTSLSFFLFSGTQKIEAKQSEWRIAAAFVCVVRSYVDILYLFHKFLLYRGSQSMLRILAYSRTLRSIRYYILYEVFFFVFFLLLFALCWCYSCCFLFVRLDVCFFIRSFIRKIPMRYVSWRWIRSAFLSLSISVDAFPLFTLFFETKWIGTVGPESGSIWSIQTQEMKVEKLACPIFICRVLTLIHFIEFQFESK